MNAEETTFDLRQEPPFPWYLRAILEIMGIGLVVLLIVAATLRPSPSGSGTHRQLGLPECSFKLLFDGKPCPSCGMTTSWSHLMRGQIISAARANIGGTMLGLLSMVVGPWFIVSGFLGRWWPGIPNEWVSIMIALVIFGVTLTNWIVRLSST